METTNKAEKQNIQIIEKVKTSLFDWVGRALFGLVVFFSYNIYTDVKTLLVVVPVLQEKITTLEKKMERMENKVFMDDRFQYPYKKEDEVTIPEKAISK